MVNRRGARIVFNKRWRDRSASPTAMLGQLGWSDLTERRRKARLVMTYEIKHGLVAIPGNRFAPCPDRLMRHDHDKKNGRVITLPKIHFLDLLCLTGMPSARKLSMPHHWRHLNTAWERLSTALPLPLAFMCPRALCKYTLLDYCLLDLVFGFENSRCETRFLGEIAVTNSELDCSANPHVKDYCVDQPSWNPLPMCMDQGGISKMFTSS